MFIDTPEYLRFRAPEERNVFRGLISLLRSLDKFAMAVTINVLLLRSLRCVVAAPWLCGKALSELRHHRDTKAAQCRLVFRRANSNQVPVIAGAD
jgi:hypothetical protein